MTSPSSLFSHPLLTLAPQESASLLRVLRRDVEEPPPPLSPAPPLQTKTTFFESKQMLESKDVRFRSSYLVFCFPLRCVILFPEKQLSSSPPSRLSIFLRYFVPSHLSSSSSVLPSNSPLQIQSFVCLAALRNQLFCIYFIAT